jgi:hypothetical protein
MAGRKAEFISQAPEVPETWETRIWGALGVKPDTQRQWLEKRQADKDDLAGLAGRDVLGGWSPEGEFTDSQIEETEPMGSVEATLRGALEGVGMASSMGGLGPANPKFGDALSTALAGGKRGRPIKPGSRTDRMRKGEVGSHGGDRRSEAFRDKTEADTFKTQAEWEALGLWRGAGRKVQERVDAILQPRTWRDEPGFLRRQMSELLPHEKKARASGDRPYYDATGKQIPKGSRDDKAQGAAPATKGMAQFRNEPNSYGGGTEGPTPPEDSIATLQKLTGKGKRVHNYPTNRKRPEGANAAWDTRIRKLQKSAAFLERRIKQAQTDDARNRLQQELGLMKAVIEQEWKKIGDKQKGFRSNILGDENE